MATGPQRLPRIDPGVPPEYGTQPIPEGMVRFNHYTRSISNLPKIMSEGLLERHAQESFARGGTESPETFASAGAVTDDFKRSHAFVEGWADPSRKTAAGEFGQLNIGENWNSDPVEHAARLEAGRNTITFRGDIPANQIIAAHQPWHEAYRHISDPTYERGIMAGDYDTRKWAAGPDPALQPAVETASMALAAKVMLGGQLQGKSYADDAAERKKATQ